MRHAIIEQERQRLLREHASKLLGYLPKVHVHFCASMVALFCLYALSWRMHMYLFIPSTTTMHGFIIISGNKTQPSETRRTWRHILATTSVLRWGRFQGQNHGYKLQEWLSRVFHLAEAIWLVKISQAQLTSCQFSARWVTGGHLDWQASLALPKTLCDYANFFATLFTEFFFSLSPCFSTLECLIVTVDMTVSITFLVVYCLSKG